MLWEGGVHVPVFTKSFITQKHARAQLEEAMVRRRTRPSFLLPAWRAVGFAVGTGSSALLPPNAVDKVGASISTIVAEQYDANIRSMYEAKIEQEEREVRDLTNEVIPVVKIILRQGGKLSPFALATGI